MKTKENDSREEGKHEKNIGRNTKTTKETREGERIIR